MILLSELLDKILTEKLCPKGKAYYNRRRAAGEKPSAYLSGRAVKVCKGLMEEDDLEESLHDWFTKEDWVRIDTEGNITGPCGTMKKGHKTTRCLPRAKANSLTKAERASTSHKKVTSNKQFVPNTKKAKVHHLNENIMETENFCPQCLAEYIREHINVLSEAEYHGRKVALGKPMQGDIKKFKVYVKDPKTGRIVKVNFGAHGMNIKRNNPKHRNAYRKRHHCENPGPRTKANYWSCRKW